METLSSVEKAVDLLFHLHRESSSRGVTAIGRALGLPKSSTHRLLATLMRLGLVEKEEGGRYRPGIGLVALGLGALEREPVVTAARPVLEAEADALDETVFIVAARAGRIVVLDKAEGSGFLRAAPQVGSNVPIHATAVGKLYLAFGGGAIQLSGEALEKFAPATQTDTRALDREVAGVVACGYAENRDEWIPGLSVVAAPVFLNAARHFSGAPERRMVAALAIAAPSLRMQSLDALEVGRRAVEAASRIGARLGGMGS